MVVEVEVEVEVDVDVEVEVEVEVDVEVEVEVEVDVEVDVDVEVTVDVDVEVDVGQGRNNRVAVTPASFCRSSEKNEILARAFEPVASRKGVTSDPLNVSKTVPGPNVHEFWT